MLKIYLFYYAALLKILPVMLYLMFNIYLQIMLNILFLISHAFSWANGNCLKHKLLILTC